MKTETNNFDSRKFITILADGKFHQSVEDGTPGSVVREYEDKEGNMKQKVELIHDSVSGIITSIIFAEGEYGKSIQIELDGDGVISASTKSNFGEDLMKKIPALDLTKEVKLTPYSFTDDSGKNRKGVTVVQAGEKVESFYWDKENKKAINGMPAPEGNTKTFDSDDWSVYFTGVRKFLIKEIEKIFPPKFEPTNEGEAVTLDDIN